MDIPRVLTRENIDQAILDYTEMVRSIPLAVKSETLLSLLQKLKRQKLMSGPYPDVTLFEAANRIMTDFTILLGVRALLQNQIPEIDFERYEVEYGNENKRPHDIQAFGARNLIGEVFNVSPSFFPVKKYSAINKLRKSGEKDDLKLLIYNEDAVRLGYKPKKVVNEFHLRVAIDF